MKWLTLIFLIPGISLAQQNEWITTDEGCQMWNPYPFSVESVSWDGPCVAGKASGEGKKVWIYRDEGGDKAKDTYQGQMENGKNHGEGIYKVDNGARYEGQWFEGKAHGEGILYGAEGDRYEGQWKNGHKDGVGTVYGSNGDTYRVKNTAEAQ